VAASPGAIHVGSAVIADFNAAECTTGARRPTAPDPGVTGYWSSCLSQAPRSRIMLTTTLSSM
jgi:hypothetical protein